MPGSTNDDRTDPRALPDYSDDSLLGRLFELQRDVRELLLAYQIKPDTFTRMAHRARQAISNTEVRANLLEMLIEMQELGTEAKKRRVLDEASMTASGKRSKDATDATAKRHGTPSTRPLNEEQPNVGSDRRNSDSDKVDQAASNDFFKRLDDS